MTSHVTRKPPTLGGGGRQVRIPRQSHRQSFDRFAETASKFVSKGLFFTISVVVVAQKIDALAAALADLMEHQANDDPALLHRHIEELRSSVELERKV